MCILFSFSQVFAQNRTVTGKVTSSEDGSPLPGVNVTVKGTSNGTSTGAEGTYSLSVPDGAILVFSFVGFAPQEIAVNNQTTLNVVLVGDIKLLTDVVVVGYGTTDKQDLTGNIAKVSGAAIQNVPVPSIEQAIQGRAAGVFIESQNGKVGQGIKIRVRGSSSVTAGNQPLYIVDGIPITTQSQSSNGAETNPVADINFNDVESIEILKDASSAAIYGSRASNGVVLITTKKGKAGKTKVGINYFYGSSKETGRREFLNAKEYVDYFRDAGKNSDLGNLSAFTESRLQRYSAGNTDYQSAKINTDWQDQVFRTAPTQQLDVNFTGGSEKTTFYISGQISDQSGILIGNRFRRISGRANLDHKVSDKFKVGVNFNLARTLNNRLSNDNQFSTPLQIVALSPITPVTDPRTNLLSGALDLNTGAPNTNFPVYYNPLLDVENTSYLATVYRNISNVYGSYTIIPGLTFRSEFGLDILSQNEDQFSGKLTVRNTGLENGTGFNSSVTITNYTTNNFLRFDKSIGDSHVFDILGGMSYQESKDNGNSISGINFASDSYKKLASAALINGGNSSLTAFSLVSYFFRGNYKFNNKYLLTLNSRVDGSSRFGKNNRYGFFPAASLGWIITEESFMKSIEFLNFLKLRGSYGITGNSEIGNFASRGLFSAANYVGVGGQAPSQLANPNLKWETTAQVDIGLEFGFLRNRISGEIDYYQKKTSDLLLSVNLDGTSGFSSFLKNIGNLENKGLEFVINSQNLVGDFKWNTSFNIATNKNKITNLDGQVIQGSYLNYAREGQPLGVFYGRQFAGADPQNGDALYYIVNADGTKTTTNQYNAATQVVLGNPNPKWIGGITNTFSYKGLELSVLFQGVQGNMIYNGGGQYMSASGSNGFDNQTKDQLNAWKKPGDITNVPQARLFSANGVNDSDRYLSDGSYLRLKNITFGYTLPSNLVSKIKMDKIRVYVSSQNLLTFTKYKGWDPEVNADSFASNINQGIDFYSAPQPKTIIMGINIGF